MYTIITKESCPFCIKAKKVFAEKNLNFGELKVYEDITREEFYERVPPGVTTVPQIWLNDEEYIGGYEDLLKHLGE